MSSCPGRGVVPALLKALASEAVDAAMETQPYRGFTISRWIYLPFLRLTWVQVTRGDPGCGKAGLRSGDEDRLELRLKRVLDP